MSPGAVNDYQKDLQFRKLNAQKDVIDVKAVRSGKTVLIKNNDIVVGDVLVLDTGGCGHRQLMDAVGDLSPGFEAAARLALQRGCLCWVELSYVAG